MNIIKRGDVSPAVKEIQTKLNIVNPVSQAIAADGDFGSETEGAVRAFQARVGIAPSGIVYPETYVALQNAVTKACADQKPMDKAVFFSAIKRLGLFGSLTQAQVEGIEAKLNAFDAAHCLLEHRAYMLATSYHETGKAMQPVMENGARAYFNKYEAGTKKGKELGNTKLGDGYLYRGRGDVQLTGKANYFRAGAALNVDLVGNPDLALKPAISAQIMIRGMTEGWFTGARLSTFISQSKKDYIGARKIVNGVDKKDLIAGYAQKFERALREAYK